MQKTLSNKEMAMIMMAMFCVLNFQEEGVQGGTDLAEEEEVEASVIVEEELVEADLDHLQDEQITEFWFQVLYRNCINFTSSRLVQESCTPSC